MAKILVFGGSSVYGFWDKDGGWTNRLRCFVDAKNISVKDYFCQVYNLGIDGDSSKNVLDRFDFETKFRLRVAEKNEEIVFIFQIGANDSQFIKSKNKKRASIDQMTSNLSEIVKLARQYSTNIFFVGLTLIDEKFTNPILRNPDIYYENSWILEYNKVIKNFCGENSIEFIEIIENPKSLSFDGLHQDSSGHEIIFNQVKEILLQKNLI
jgi:lysophospholipase L1-like esterase